MSLNSDFIEKIYKEHYEYLKLLVINSIHTPNPDDITSCVQDVFMVAMQKEGLEDHANIKGWLLKTTKNIVKTFNRQKAIRNKYYDFYSDLKEDKLVTESFLDMLIEEIDSERLKNIDIDRIIMESLSQSERDFYVLLRFEKLSIKEISKRLSISEGAAATRHTRFKDKIKKIIKNL